MTADFIVQRDKLQKEALKAEAAEMKKWVKEKQKWERGKYALKSIVAEIDAKVVEDGLVGGTANPLIIRYFSECLHEFHLVSYLGVLQDIFSPGLRKKVFLFV